MIFSLFTQRSDFHAVKDATHSDTVRTQKYEFHEKTQIIAMTKAINTQLFFLT
jgi:hypothetical protein